MSGGEDPWAVANHALIANAVSGEPTASKKNIYGLAAAAAQYAALQVITATTGGGLLDSTAGNLQCVYIYNYAAEIRCSSRLILALGKAASDIRCV